MCTLLYEYIVSSTAARMEPYFAIAASAAAVVFVVLRVSHHYLDASSAIRTKWQWINELRKIKI